MNVCVYKHGALLYEAQYIEDTVDGMIVVLPGDIEQTRILMDKDYNFTHDVSEEHFGVLYRDEEGHLCDKLIPMSLKEKFEAVFVDIPSYYNLESWLKEVDGNNS